MELYSQINGTGEFRMRNLENNQVHEFSVKRKALLYSFAPEIIHHEPSKGHIFQIPLGFKNYYEIDYGYLVMSHEGMKWKQIFNDIMKGHKFMLTPNINLDTRAQEVFLDPKRVMQLHENYWKQGNKNLAIGFMTERVLELDWEIVDTPANDYIPVGPELNQIVY